MGATLSFIACSGTAEQKFAYRETPPCENCLSSDPLNVNLKVKNSFCEPAEFCNALTTTRDSVKSNSLQLDSGEIIGVLPALKVIAESPDPCNYCHAFSESAVEFDFAAKEDSVLRTWFPNNERVLIYDTLNFQKIAKALDTIPLSQNRRVKSVIKKIGEKYNTRFLVFASLIYVKITSEKSFEWESEWSIWDTQKGELLFWNYRNLEATTAQVNKDWAATAF